MQMNERESGKFNVKIFRFDPSKDKHPHYDIFKVPFGKINSSSGAKYTVLDVLKFIKANYDKSLSFYASCLVPFYEARKQGHCGRAICNVFVNGKPVLTCEETVTGEEDLLIEPASADSSLGFKVLKDIIADDVTIREKDYYFIARKKAFNVLRELNKRRSLVS